MTGLNGLAAVAALSAASAAVAATPELEFFSGDLFDLQGNLITPRLPESPAGGTYDILPSLANPNNGQAFLIGDPNDPTDNVVTFDNVPEDTQDVFNGTSPTVSEMFTPGNPRSIWITLDGNGGELFPSGATDPNTGEALTTGVFFVGALGDVVDVMSPAAVSAATIDFLAGGASILGGPADISGLLADPWDGFVGISLTNLAGAGVDEVRFHITLIPAPGAAALFGLAGLAAVRRRR